MHFGPLRTLLPAAWMCVSCYPDFVFGTGDSGGGDDATTVGSSGGSTNLTSTGRATSVGVGQGGGGKGPILIGGDDAGGRVNGSGGGGTGNGGAGGSAPVGAPCVSEGTFCDFGETCCYDTLSPYVDRCAASCTSNDLTFQCHDDDDCLDKQCCVEVDFFDDVTAIKCKTSCAGDDYEACSSTSQCGSGQSCYALFPSEAAYDTYGYCSN